MKKVGKSLRGGDPPPKLHKGGPNTGPRKTVVHTLTGPLKRQISLPNNSQPQKQQTYVKGNYGTSQAHLARTIGHGNRGNILKQLAEQQKQYNANQKKLEEQQKKNNANQIKSNNEHQRNAEEEIRQKTEAMDIRDYPERLYQNLNVSSVLNRLPTIPLRENPLYNKGSLIKNNSIKSRHNTYMTIGTSEKDGNSQRLPVTINEGHYYSDPDIGFTPQTKETYYSTIGKNNKRNYSDLLNPNKSDYMEVKGQENANPYSNIGTQQTTLGRKLLEQAATNTKTNYTDYTHNKTTGNPYETMVGVNFPVSNSSKYVQMSPPSVKPTSDEYVELA